MKVSPHWGSEERVIEDLALFVPAWNVVLPTATWDALFGAGSRLSQKPWYALSKFGVSGNDYLSTIHL